MPDSQANVIALFGTAAHVKANDLSYRWGYISGSGSPVGSLTPLFIGQEYLDTSGNNWWRSNGTGNTNWVEVGGSTDALGTTTITSASANALAVGANGATHPVLNVDASTTSVATGLNIKGAAAAAGLALAVISSGAAENLTLDALGTGTITLNGTATGVVVVGHGLNVTGAEAITSASATAFAVGLAGTTNPALNVDASTASSATGLNIKSAAAAAGLALSVISSGTPENLTVDAKGTGTITLNGTATGAVHVGHGLTVDAGGLTVTAGTTTLPGSTATVAPLVMTSGTLLTTAAAGAIEYDGVAFYATAVASARQQLDAEQFVIATNNSSTYNGSGLDSAAAAAVFTSTMGATANGAITLVAGKTYAFEAVYLLTNTGTTSHTWSVLFGGNASYTSIAYSIFGLSSTASTPATGGLTGYATVATAIVATAASTSATENVTIQLNGVLTVNAGGTLIPQMQASARPGASGTPGVTVLKGSYFRIWEMAGTGTVGNWS